MSLHNDNLITIEVQALRNLVEEAYWAGQSERNAPGGFLEDMLTGYRYSVKKGGDA